jgi:hypothetical protein
VCSAIFAAMSSAYPSAVFNPVPTAVPPSATRYKATMLDSTRRLQYSTCCAYPENS